MNWSDILNMSDGELVDLIVDYPIELNMLSEYKELSSDRLVGVVLFARSIHEETRRLVLSRLLSHPNVTPDVLRVIFDNEEGGKQSMAHMSYEQIMGIAEEQRDVFLESGFSYVPLNTELTAEQLVEIAKVSFSRLGSPHPLNRVWMEDLFKARDSDPDFAGDFSRLLVKAKGLPLSAAVAIVMMDSPPDDVKMRVVMDSRWRALTTDNALIRAAYRMENPAVDVYLESVDLTYNPGTVRGNLRMEKIRRAVVFYLKEYEELDIPDGIPYAYIKKLLQASKPKGVEKLLDSFPRNYMRLHYLELC